MWLLSKVQTSALHSVFQGNVVLFSSDPCPGWEFCIFCCALSQGFLWDNTAEPQVFSFPCMEKGFTLNEPLKCLSSVIFTLCSTAWEIRRSSVSQKNWVSPETASMPSWKYMVSHSFLHSTFSHFASCPSWKQKLPEVHENEKRWVKYIVNLNFQTPIRLNYDFIQSGSRNYFSQVLML